MIGEVFFLLSRYETADLASNCSISDSNEGDRVEWTIKKATSKKIEVDKKKLCAVVGGRLKDILEC